MEQTKEYFAFISYKSEDVEWAIWLQHELEHYHLPASFNGRTDVRQELRPVFRDMDELSAGNLPAQIQQALANSQNLIVVCSPLSASSQWVNKEVETFISMGKTNRIFPFIVEGSSPTEFFPPALLNLPKDDERLGGDVSKNGRDAAFVKTVAGMLEVSFDSLWGRYEREKIEEQQKLIETNNKILRNQARFITEKALSVLESGDSYLARLLVLEVLPKNIAHPERPYIPEAELALRRISDYQTAILREHNEYAYYAEFSPDGHYVVAATGLPGGGGGRICLWDAKTGQFLKRLEGHITSTMSAKFNKTGDLIVSAGGRTVCIWDVKKGIEIATFEAEGGDFTYAEFSPDGKYVLALMPDTTVRIWRWRKGTFTTIIDSSSVFSHPEYYSPNPEDSRVPYFNSVMYCPDGENIVLSSYSDPIAIWNIRTEKVIKTIDCGDFRSIAISPDGKTITSANKDNTIRIWDLDSGKEIKVLKGHTSSIVHIAYSNDGNLLVSSSYDNTIRIWDVTEGMELYNFENKDALALSVTFSPDCKSVVSASYRYVKLLDIGQPLNRRIIKEDTGNIICARYFSDGKRFATSSNGENEIKIWDKEKLTISKRLKGDNYYLPFTISKNDKFIVMVDYPKLRVWDVEREKEIRIFKDDESHFTCATFSPDCKYLHTILRDGRVKILHIESGREVKSINLGKVEVGLEKISFSTDGTKISSWSQNLIYIYDLIANKCKKLKGHTEDVNYSSFSPDGIYVVSASCDGSIKIWNLKTGEVTILKGHEGEVRYVEFNHDGNRIISASKDNTVRIWDVHSGLELYRITTHSKKRFEGATIGLFNPKTSEVLTISEGEPITAYGEPTEFVDVDTGEVFIEPKITIIDNDVIDIRRVTPLQQLINDTRERFKNRPLTAEERRKYYLD